MLQGDLPQMQMVSLININTRKIVIEPPLKLFALWPHTLCIIAVKVHHFKGFLITANEYATSVRAQKRSTLKDHEDKKARGSQHFDIAIQLFLGHLSHSKCWGTQT